MELELASQAKLAHLGLSETKYWAHLTFWASSESSTWFTMCFTRSMESKSMVCLSGMDRSSTCLRLVSWECRQVRHYSGRLKCCLRVRLVGVSTQWCSEINTWSLPNRPQCSWDQYTISIELGELWCHLLLFLEEPIYQSPRSEFQCRVNHQTIIARTLIEVLPAYKNTEFQNYKNKMRKFSILPLLQVTMRVVIHKEGLVMEAF